VVHLTGTVGDQEAHDEAEREARGVEGVREVVNDLQVGPELAAEVVADATLTARLKAKLAASADLNPFAVEVNTLHGVVSLAGRVETAEQKALAERIARATSGVREVENLLEVGQRE
jgi:osmotically-inducible protein OsmY